jgi:hypothetical protein
LWANLKAQRMENPQSKFSINVITAIVVLVVVIILIITKASEIKEENKSARQGTNSSVSK